MSGLVSRTTSLKYQYWPLVAWAAGASRATVCAAWASTLCTVSGCGPSARPAGPPAAVTIARTPRITASVATATATVGQPARCLRRPLRGPPAARYSSRDRASASASWLRPGGSARRVRRRSRSFIGRLLRRIQRVGVAQRFAQGGPGPVQPRSHRADRDAQRSCDLLVAKIGPGEQQQHIPITLG